MDKDLGLALIAAVTYRNECEMEMIEFPTEDSTARFQRAKKLAFEAKTDYEKGLSF